VTLLTVCTFLPTIFLRFLAGSAVDRWNKKRVMLIADLVAPGGLDLVLIIDLATFAVAFLVLLFLIRIPEAEQREAKEEPFSKTCLAGIRYLREHTAILRITLFLAVINFLAKLGNDGMLSPFILGRTGNNPSVLGAVESFTALGVLAGSLLMTLRKPPRKRTRLIFLTTGLVFAGNIVQSLTSRPWLWCAAAFGSYLMAAVMNVNMDTMMREKVPMEMQGRVFSAKSTLQNFTIPPALLLGGLLADMVFEPFMAAESPAQRFLSGFFGTGKGSGIGLMFFIVGIAGMLISFTRLRKPVYRELDRTETIQANEWDGGKEYEQQ
jgi:MFS family permease